MKITAEFMHIRRNFFVSNLGISVVHLYDNRDCLTGSILSIFGKTIHMYKNTNLLINYNYRNFSTQSYYDDTSIKFNILPKFNLKSRNFKSLYENKKTKISFFGIFKK